MTTSANVFRPFVKAESAEIFKAFFNAEQSARAKHPVFAHFFQNEPRSRIGEYRQTLRELQSENDRAEREHRASAVNIMLEELCEVFMAHYDPVTCNDCAKLYCQIKNAPWNEVEDAAMDRGIYDAVKEEKN